MAGYVGENPGCAAFFMVSAKSAIAEKVEREKVAVSAYCAIGAADGEVRV